MNRKETNLQRRKDVYCVIHGDMIDSRKMAPQDRDEAGLITREKLERINEEYRSYFLSGFAIASGDDFEAVLLAQYKAPVIIQRIIKELYSTSRLRISMGIGELYTYGDTDRVNTMDGPAFHNAADAMSLLKKSKSKHWLQLSIQTNQEAQPLVNATLSLLSAVTKHWTNKQRQVVWDTERLNGDVVRLANEMNVTVNAVRKHLKAADYEAYRGAWVALEEYLVNINDTQIANADKISGYTIYLNAAYRFFDKGELKSAEESTRKALNIAESTYGQCDPILATILNKLGEVLLGLGKYDEAKSVLTRSLSIQEGLPPGRDARLHALMFLGETQYQLKDFDEARKIMAAGKEIELSIRGKRASNQFNWDGLLNKMQGA